MRHAPFDRLLAHKITNLFCTCGPQPELKVDQILEVGGGGGGANFIFAKACSNMELKMKF